MSIYFDNYKNIQIQIDPSSKRCSLQEISSLPVISDVNAFLQSSPLQWPIRFIDEQTREKVIRSAKVRF